MVFCSLVFLNLRFYVPILFATAVLLWSVLRSPWKGKFALVALAVTCIYVLLENIQPSVEFGTGFGEGIIFSLGKAILSPTPWSIVPEYSFLTIPALLHLIATPFAVVGGIWLSRANRLCALLVIYFLLILLLVAFQPEYFGPRHRFQGSSCLILMQFVGFCRLFRRTPRGQTFPG